MTGTLLKALVASVPVAALLVYAVDRYRLRRSNWSLLLIVGALCFGIVILTHIAEALHLFPAMGWGEPHSVGHYIDLTSAVAGAVFFAAGILSRVRAKMGVSVGR